MSVCLCVEELVLLTFASGREGEAIRSQQLFRASRETGTERQKDRVTPDFGHEGE